MKILEGLRSARKKKLSKNLVKNVSELAEVYQGIGGVLRVTGTTIETVSKALQSTEGSQEIFNCITDIRNRVLDTLISIVTANQEEFGNIEKCAAEFAQELKQASKPKGKENASTTEDDTETTGASV